MVSVTFKASADLEAFRGRSVAESWGRRWRVRREVRTHKKAFTLLGNSAAFAGYLAYWSVCEYASPAVRRKAANLYETPKEPTRMAWQIEVATFAFVAARTLSLIAIAALSIKRIGGHGIAQFFFCAGGASASEPRV